MPELPRAILFDLDDTLLSFGRRVTAMRLTLDEMAAALGPVDRAALTLKMDAAYQAFWQDQDRHRQWRQNLGAARIMLAREVFAAERAAGAATLTDALADDFGARFHAHREQGARCFPGALETVDELRRRGVRLALVTNGAAEAQRAKVAQFELAHRFEHIQIEGEHGFGKPEPRAYQHALQALGVGAHETWMVGDNLEWEVAAPQRLGIYSIWHDHLGDGLPKDSDITPDRIILSIPELLE